MYEKELQKIRELYAKGAYKPEFYSRNIPGLEALADYESFSRLPFMYKDDIRTTTAFERTTTPPGEIYGIFSSSGTTGEKTYYVYSKTDKIVHEKFVKTFYSELGIEPTDLGGVFAPVDTGVMAHTMMWQFTTMGAGYVNCPEPSPQNMIHVVSSLPVTVIATRPNVVSSICHNPEFVRQAQKSAVKKLITGGGFLSSERRKLLERIWGADCYNMFGMSEMFGPMAGECRKKDGQHYLDDYLFIEIVDPQTLRPVPRGEVGVAVYTTLWDKGFPLLRYWTDDLMRIDTTPCACGSPLPRLRYIGRMADCLQVNGRYVFPEQLENVVMKHGFYLDYRAQEQPDGRVAVQIEKLPEQTVPDILYEEVQALFDGAAQISFVLPGECQYPGHGPRFVKAGISTR